MREYGMHQNQPFDWRAEMRRWMQENNLTELPRHGGEHRTARPTPTPARTLEECQALTDQLRRDLAFVEAMRDG